MSTNRLTDLKVRTAKPTSKPYKLSDGGGLFLLINPNGTRYWRFKYRFGGKEKLLGLGVYPAVTLAEARIRRDQAKSTLARVQDPSQVRREAKHQAAVNAANSFEHVARAWHQSQAAGRWTPNYAQKVMQGLEKHIFPSLGHLPIKAVTASMLLRVLRDMQLKGTVDRANRLRQTCGEVFRYGIITDCCQSDPARDLARALQPSRQRHFASLSQDQLPTFLRALASERLVTKTTCLGLRLLALTFVRPGELRQARWDEFDFSKAMWEVPAERMKMREPHLVPLSKQALAALRELHAITGAGELLFPSRSSMRRPVSDNTFRLALHNMGFPVTAHGFRSTASTILNESKLFRLDVIERQLAHGEKNKSRGAYNRAEYLEERREMMACWGQYLQELEQHGARAEIATPNRIRKPVHRKRIPMPSRNEIADASQTTAKLALISAR